LCLRRWRGDLRRLHLEAGDDPVALGVLVQQFPGIGPTGAAIFLREVQAVWPGICPYLDDRARLGARRAGLPEDPQQLAALTDSPSEFAALVAGCVRRELGHSSGASG
jgi:hypothetical protein